MRIGYAGPVTDRASPPVSRLGISIAAPLAALALYGVVSTPGLAAHWGASPGGAALLLAWLTICLIAIPLTRQAPDRWSIVPLISIAAALRIGVALCFANRRAAGDAHSYLDLAATLTAGHGLHIYEPFIGLTLQAFYPPVYPLLLAGWQTIAGTSALSLIALNALVDSTAATLLARLATMVGRRGAGRGAAWLYLVWPSVLLSSPLAQKEGLCVVLVLGLAIAWLRALDAPSGRRWEGVGLIGALAAVLALTQPGLAPLAFLFGIVLVPLASLRRVLAIGLRALPFAIVAMLPWWVRNWSMLDAFVPLTSAGNVSLWIGNNPDATGNWMPEPPARGLPELGYGRAMAALAETWIRQHPAAFVRLTVTKLIRACGIAQFGIVRLWAMTPRPVAAMTALLFPVSQASHLLLLGGTATAAATRIRRLPIPLLLLIGAAALQIVMFGVWFEFGERHREFATPFLLLLLTSAFPRPGDQGTTVTNR